MLMLSSVAPVYDNSRGCVANPLVVWLAVVHAAVSMQYSFGTRESPARVVVNVLSFTNYDTPASVGICLFSAFMAYLTLACPPER